MLFLYTGIPCCSNNGAGKSLYIEQAKYLHSKYLGTEVWTITNLKYLCRFYQFGAPNLKSIKQNFKIHFGFQVQVS